MARFGSPELRAQIAHHVWLSQLPPDERAAYEAFDLAVSRSPLVVDFPDKVG